MIRKIRNWLSGSRPDGIDGRMDAEAEKKWVERAPRVKIAPLHGVVFVPSDGSSRRPLAIANLSSTGVGFIRKERDEWPLPGEKMPGLLRIRDARFEVEIEIVHVSSVIAGGRYTKPTAELADAIASYFAMEISGIALAQVNPAMLRREKDGTPHWFLGKNNCEVYYVEKEGEILRFNLSYFGNYIEGSRNRPVRFGYVVEEDDHDKPAYKGASLVRWQSRMTSENLIEGALTLIQSSESIPEAHKAALAAMMNEAPVETTG